MITPARQKHRHRALVICSERLVKLIVKSRGIRKHKRKKESADDRQCENLAPRRGLTAKKIQPHGSEFAAARELRKRDFRSPEVDPIEQGGVEFHRITNHTHDG